MKFPSACLLVWLATWAGSRASAPDFTGAIPPPLPVVADWTFDEGTPGRRPLGIADQSGHRHDSIQIFGAPQFAPAACGGGTSLGLPPGAPFGFGSGFLVADSPRFDFTQAFTLEAVFAPGRDGFGFWRQVVGRDGGDLRPGMAPWSLSFNEATREVAFSVMGDDQTVASVAAPLPDDGARHQVAGVYSNLVLRLYVDGVLAGTAEAPSPPAAGPMAGVSVGANSIGGFWLTGELDRVRITAAALAPGQFLDACERFPAFRLEAGEVAQLGPRNAGGAWGDFDGDGLPDLLVLSETGGPALYRNDGEGRLVLFSADLGGPASTGRHTAAAWADMDGDGDLDLALAGYGRPGALLENIAGKLVVRSGALGAEDRRSVSVTWMDANRDGRPDVVLANEAAPGADLWLNLGDGRFERRAYGPFASDQPPALAAAVADLDLDGYADILVARQGAANGVWYNAGGTNFIAAPTGSPITAYVPPGSTGAAVGQGFPDERPGLFFANEGGTNGWWRPGPGGDFVPAEAGAVTGEARSAVWADLDNDGFPDLITVGRSNRLAFFLGSSGGGLRRAGLAPLLPGTAADVRSCAVADADGDGFLDVAAFSSGAAPGQLLLNTGNGNAWLRLLPRGPSAPDGRGVRVKISMFSPAPWPEQHREIGSGDSRAGHELAAHFGLGTVTNVDRVEVHWPSGAHLVLTNVPARQTLTVAEPDFGTPGLLQVDRQTGLLLQRVAFHQLRADATNAVRLVVRGVPDDARLVGGERTGPGEWSLLFRGPMARLDTTLMEFEFYRASRVPFQGTAFSVAEVAPRPQDEVPAGAAGVTVDRALALDDGRLLVEFAATPGARYLVQYADALGEWRNAAGTVTAGGTRVQWVDAGAPKTAPRPAGTAGRFYRVFRLDAAAP